MRRKILNIPLEGRYSLLALMIAAVSILAILGGATPQALAQCNWSTKVILSHHTNAQPGLTASGDRLILTWAGSSDGAFNSMISFDGVNWFNHALRTDFPRIALGHSGSIDNPHPSGGLGLTHSPPCGFVYAGWRDNSNNMWATRSVDGVNWETPRKIIRSGSTSPSAQPSPNLPCFDCCPDCPPPPPPPPPSGVPGTALSAPALRGDDGSLPIGFAVTTPSDIDPSKFKAFKGKFNCDFSNIVFPISANFFENFGGSSSPPLTNPGTPGWTGAFGTTKLSAVATGPPGVGFGQIQVELNNGFIQALGFHWSNNGVATTVNPNDGTAYVAWTCHDGGGDNCSPDSTGNINIRNINTGAHQTCADWSIHNPAMAFFQGKIWIAWRGNESGQTGFINIASLNPF